MSGRFLGRVFLLVLLSQSLVNGDDTNNLQACPAHANQVIGVCPLCEEGKPCRLTTDPTQCPMALPAEDCPVGHFCPWGTPLPIPCPSGFVCKTTGLSEAPPCREGFYCPKSDAGLYDTELPCTKGHFCRSHTEFPIKCTWGSDCGEGETVSQRSRAVGPLIIALLLVLVIIKVLYGNYETAKNKARMDVYKRKLEEVERESKHLQAYVQAKGGSFSPKSIHANMSFPHHNAAMNRIAPNQSGQPPHQQQQTAQFPQQASPQQFQGQFPQQASPQQFQGGMMPANLAQYQPYGWPQQQGAYPTPSVPFQPSYAGNQPGFFGHSTVIGSAFGGAEMQQPKMLDASKVEAYLSRVDSPETSAGATAVAGQADTFRFQGLTYKTSQIQLGFNRVHLKVPAPTSFIAGLTGEKNWKPVLKDVTGRINAGKLTAIMGPSGSGKSSLLNVLTGKASYGVVEGEFLINGVADDLRTYSQSMGFVPQDDVMLEELTVLENLYYGAQLRLPSSVPKAQKLAVVNDVIRVLGLEHIAHTPVGNVEKRGISGGERKRVNIGLELVADPTLLFLDEPTSGLDSTTSLKVLRALKRFCKIGATVITVIHQPRALIFNMFDDVILLKKGGQITYAGPASLAEEYFISLGFWLPHGENPADWVIDIISGDFVLNFGDPTGSLPGPEELVAIWDQQGKQKVEQMKAGKNQGKVQEFTPQERAELEGVFMQHDQDGNGVLDKEELSRVIGQYLGAEKIVHWFNGIFSTYDKGHGVALPNFIEAMQDIMKGGALDHGVQADPRVYPRASGSVRQPSLNRRPPSGFHVFLRCFVRDLKQKWRKSDLVVRDILLVCIGAVGLGLLNGTEGLPSDTVVAVLQSHTAMGLLSCIIALRAFGLERENRWREAATGLNISAYFFAKVLGQLLEVVVLAAFFALMYHQMVAPRAEAHIYLFVFWALTYAVSPFGMIFSIIMKPATSMIAAVLFPMIAVAALAGLSPQFPDMEPGSLDFIGLFAPGRWSVESNTVFEWKVEEEASGFVGPVVRTLMDEEYGFKRDADYDNIGWLFLLGTVWRVICFLVIQFDAWRRRA